ncbi:hypothetical protein ILUMI_18222, partial [Ignelater luminosus]
KIDTPPFNKTRRYQARLKADLRSRFRKEYLSLLVTIIEKGGVSLARIIEMYPGSDGVVRVVRLRMASGELVRPVQRCYHLEVTEPLLPSAGAIYANAHGDINRLKEDIRNTVNHVFENHFNCREDICDRTGETVDERTPELNSGAHHHIYGALGQLNLLEKLSIFPIL